MRGGRNLDKYTYVCNVCIVKTFKIIIFNEKKNKEMLKEECFNWKLNLFSSFYY